MYMYMQDHMTNDTYVIVQKRELILVNQDFLVAQW